MLTPDWRWHAANKASRWWGWPFFAHRFVRALFCMIWSKQTEAIWAAPRRAGHALSRGRTTTRPSPQTVSALSGLDRSAKNAGNNAVRPLPRCKQSGLEPVSRLHATLWQPHQLISGRALTARTKILHTRGSSAPRWMGLVSRTADKANPTSSVTHPSRLWPGSVDQIHPAG